MIQPKQYFPSTENPLSSLHHRLLHQRHNKKRFAFRVLDADETSRSSLSFCHLDGSLREFDAFEDDEFQINTNPKKEKQKNLGMVDCTNSALY